ncbi:phosphopantetheine-binding protein [Campylobacter vicugnae]|uniref:phosphopantetheine-binding protein n=1 Tax=Campylobacter vicugnae TaxID=1660076 RepID=UPI002551BF5F|nr:phosphopantetheine-binding protein [Campylobacter ovis]MDL0095295.1 phosphopantetheine-binding protein [Campylobacter ovis]
MINEIKQLIITSLNLPDLKLSDIDENAPLFNEGLGLDSVDALELSLAIKKQYDIELNAKTMDLKSIFYSVKTLSDFIKEQKGK